LRGAELSLANLTTDGSPP